MRANREVVVRVVVLTAMLATALGGCGSGSAPSNGEASKPAAQILSDAAATLKRVHSMRMQGTLVMERHPTTIALAIERPGKLSLTFKQGARQAIIVVVAGVAYMKANASVYESQAAVPRGAVGLVADRWFKLPSAEGVSSFTKGLDLDSLSRCLVENHGTLVPQGTATVDGQPTVVISDKGDLPGSTPGRLYVAASGAPLPLRMVATGPQRPGGTPDAVCNNESSEPGQAGGQLTFSDYNRSMNIAAPASAVDIGQLAH